MALKYILVIAACALLLAAAPARADAPVLESSTPFLPQAVLVELVAEIAAAGKTQNRNPDLPGRRLRLSCGHQPLPPGWAAGADKARFAWSCLAAWEGRTPLATGEVWLPEAEELFAGGTDGDPAATREALRQRLYPFFQMKPPAAKSP